MSRKLRAGNPNSKRKQPGLSMEATHSLKAHSSSFAVSANQVTQNSAASTVR